MKATSPAETTKSQTTRTSLKFLVYGLVDPRTDLIRYIGKSSIGMRRPRRAMYSHQYVDDYKTRWLKQLKGLGLKCEIVILDICRDAEHVKKSERLWIKLGREYNWPLTNITDGGDGGTGRVWTDEQRRRHSEILSGRPKSKSHRKALGDSLRGRRLPEEHRRKISATHKARVAANPAELRRLQTLRSRSATDDDQRSRRR